MYTHYFYFFYQFTARDNRSLILLFYVL